MNNQPWRFLVITEQAKRDSIAQYTTYAQILQSAPACILIFLETHASYDRTKDVMAVGACIQNMLLSAHELGLGAVWLGEILNRRQQVECELGVAEGLELMAVLAVGYPSQKGSSSRKRLDELML